MSSRVGANELMFHNPQPVMMLAKPRVLFCAPLEDPVTWIGRVGCSAQKWASGNEVGSRVSESFQ